MKTYFLISTIALMMSSAFLFTAATKTNSVSTGNQKISLSIFKDYDYNSDVYKDTYVQITVSLDKVVKGKRTSIWTKTYDPTELAAFPTLDEAISQNISVRGMKIRKEQLVVSYKLEYKTGDKILALSSSQLVDSNNGNIKISI